METLVVWLLTLLAIVVIFLAAGARTRASRRYNLPENPALALAILKENLLENPSEHSLQKLTDFAAAHGLNIQDEYPSGKAPTIEQDDDIFARQAAWLDRLTPLEFNECTERALVSGILRLYSDEAIFKAFAELAKKFPSERQQKLEESYRKLCELRDSSKADYDSLEKLRMEKEKWEHDAKEFLT